MLHTLTYAFVATVRCWHFNDHFRTAALSPLTSGWLRLLITVVLITVVLPTSHLRHCQLLNICFSNSIFTFLVLLSNFSPWYTTWTLHFEVPSADFGRNRQETLLLLFLAPLSRIRFHFRLVLLVNVTTFWCGVHAWKKWVLDHQFKLQCQESTRSSCSWFCSALLFIQSLASIQYSFITKSTPQEHQFKMLLPQETFLVTISCSS